MFRLNHVNPIDDSQFMAQIKPGYILMNEREYLLKNAGFGVMHSRLIRDFTGKDLG